MNLLFTSAGRRGYLIEYFVEALGGQGRVHVGNSDPLCCAFTVGDTHVVTPPIHSSEYLPFLHDYCRRERIDAILPLFDIDATVLSSVRADFAEQGVILILPKQQAATLCSDKWHMYEALCTAGIGTPTTFLNPEVVVNAVEHDEVAFPFIIKPRFGMGSIGLMQAEDADELHFLYQLVRRQVFCSHLRHESSSVPDACVLIQERAAGSEYGLDVLNDLLGRHVVTVAKRKLAMRSGETDVATTENRPDLSELGARLGDLLGHLGNLDVDVIVNGPHLSVLDLNCRFGGGYLFTHAAGANFPAAIVAWLRGLEPDPKCFLAKNGVTALKSIRPRLVATRV